ncbi:hypothetical protein B566_EDAN016505 [Ephemera danica]|nr:hypothetical protein B566_EDAN016505 [Ephemera danica]
MYRKEHQTRAACTMNSNGTSATNHTTPSPTGGTPSSSRKALALDLKRSSKVDFTRERSFVQYSRRGGGRSGNVAVTVQQQQHQAAVAAAAGRAAGKPSLEIYRPPSESIHCFYIVNHQLNFMLVKLIFYMKISPVFHKFANSPHPN